MVTGEGFLINLLINGTSLVLVPNSPNFSRPFGGLYDQPFVQNEGSKLKQIVNMRVNHAAAVESMFILDQLIRTAQCHGFQADIVEDGLAHVERLSQMTASQRRRISEIASSSQELALLHHKTHSDALNRTVGFHVELSQKKAKVLNCHPSVLDEIKWASEQALNDWRSCLNISIPVGHLVELGISFAANLELAETVICEGIKNVTHCNETRAFDRFICVSEAVEECTEMFMSNTKGVLYWISKFDDVLQELGLQIARCLNITNISFFKDLESKFDERCQRMNK